MQFCSFQLYTKVKIKFIHGKDSVTLPKKSFQSLHNVKGWFNNMQKFNRLVTRVLPYLQPHVQSCGFTKKINSESWDCLTMCKNFLIFNPMCKVVTLQKNHFRVLGLFINMQKLPYLQSHVRGCGLWS